MFAIDSLVLDLVYGVDAKPTPEALSRALGGDDIAKTRLILDPDRDAPGYELQVSPTVPLRRRGERRILIVDESVAPLRKSPRSDPIVPKDLRLERDRLLRLVSETAARLGRMNAFGTWGDAAIVVRSMRDLRGLLLLGWALDPMTDIDGRSLAAPLPQADFEAKLAAWGQRQGELDDQAVLARIAPATLTKRDELYCVDVLSDRDGSWDIRKSYELEQRIAAVELFARIPGAPALIVPAEKSGSTRESTIDPRGKHHDSRGITVHDLHGRLILSIPRERFSLDLAFALGRNNLDTLGKELALPKDVEERIHRDGCGFISALAFLSEVFLDGKPLDKARFASTAEKVGEGTFALETRLPRFGPVMVLEHRGQRYMTSELTRDRERIEELLRLSPESAPA